MDGLDKIEGLDDGSALASAEQFPKTRLSVHHDAYTNPVTQRAAPKLPGDPDTTVEAYLERCALKTGKLIEAACLLGSGGNPALGAYGRALGIAFQIADDILDCAGQTQETGKIPGTDLREGTPTMPLLLAAQQDPEVRAALAGGPLDGALVRVAATDALARSREAALDYAAGARSHLDREPHREELAALTYAVVDRAS